MRWDRRRRALRRLRHCARNRCTANIVDHNGAERFCGSIGANRSQRIVPICQCTRPPRGRDRRDTARAERQSSRRHTGRPAGSGGEPVLRQPRMPPAGRACTGRPARTRSGLLHRVWHAILVRSQAIPRGPGWRAVRSTGVHCTRRSRLDLPSDRPQCAQPLGGTQGLAELRRCGRHGRRCCRSPRPRRSGTSEHRPDP